MSLYNSEQFGKTTRYWIGQIVDDSEWKENRPGEKYAEASEIPGWGYRYKVRIFGKHPESGLSDVELPFADVLYPITSGSGHGSSFQTPNLRKGTYVFGVYLDGMDETQPLIMGCFGNNDQTKLKFSRSNKGFVPVSGLYGGEKVPIYSIPPGGSGPKGGPEPHEGTGTGDNSQTETDNIAKKDGEQETTLPISEKCAKSLDKTQIELKKFISKIEDIQKSAKNWSYWVNGVIGDISNEIQRTAQFIAKEIKRIINGIREFITTKIDDLISNIYNKFFPSEEKEIEKQHNEAISILTCLFNKIIANLIKMIGDLLTEIVGKVVNSVLCLVENILSTILGQLLGIINSVLGSIFGPLSALIGSTIDLAGDILGFVKQILGFFICDEDSACPENTKWSLWKGGSSSMDLDFDSIFNNAKSIADSFTEIVDPDNFDFNLDFSSILDTSCDVGPEFCAPPTVDFYGGGGSGASGNVIISTTGDILGVDIINRGSGYSSPPSVNFIDNCGNGNGASGRSVISDGEVIEVIIDNPGFGYLPDINGGRGGDGREFARPDQIIIKRENGLYEVFDQDDTFEIFDNDIVDGPYVLIDNTQQTPEIIGEETPGIIGEETPGIIGGEAPEILVGEAPGTLIPIERSKLNTNTKGKYDVILSISGIVIDSTGVNYSPTDKIVVEPSNGAVIEPIFGPFGSIIDVNIVNPGIGFTVRPNIYIETETGYNVELIPVLTVIRKEDISDDIPFGEKVVKVIDCVGKI